MNKKEVLSSVVGNVASEMIDMSNVTSFASRYASVSSEYLESLDITDITDEEEAMLLEYEIAESALDINQDSDEDDEIADFVSELETYYRIDTHSNLFQWLLDWYGRNENGIERAFYTMKKTLNGFVDHGSAIYFYTDLSDLNLNASLFGGNQSSDEALNAFYQYINGAEASSYESVRNSIINN